VEVSRVIKLLDRNVARNPVARAIAKQQLKQAMLDMRISLLLMEEGDNVSDHILTISDSIHVVAACYELMDQNNSREARMLRSAMKVMRECSENSFKWRKDWAITIDNAINICSENWTKIPSTTFQRAMKQILG
jgi:hypothetical protein